MIHLTCRECGQQFDSTARAARWCPACRDAKCARICAGCGESFIVTHPASRVRFHSLSCATAAAHARGVPLGRKRTLPDAVCEYCGETFYPLTRLKRNRFCRREHADAWQRQKHAAPHACQWPDCPRRGDLLTGYGSDPSKPRKYHPECYRAWQHAGGGAKRKRTGQELVCSRCHTGRGYRYPSELRHRRDYHTGLCQKCWKAQRTAARVTVTCAWCAKNRLPGARFTLPPHRITRHVTHHFHNVSERARYYGEMVRKYHPCPQCGGRVERPDHTYCTRACLYAARAGKPRRGPSKAEGDVLEAYRQGVRGVRPLAKAAGVSTTTVLKLKREGKLIEPSTAAERAQASTSRIPVAS